MKKKALWMVSMAMLVVLLFVGNIGFKQIFSLPEGFLATYDEIEEANQKHLFGSFVTAKMARSDETASTGEANEGVVEFKLFGFIPIRKMRVVCSNEEEVYLGGVPIGISLSSKGAIVMGERMVETEDGLKETQKEVKFHEGDLLTEVNGKKVDSLDELKEIVEASEDGEFEITYLRADKPHKAIIKGERDAETQKYKLGFWVRDDVNGVGTLTYVGKAGDFAALGHAITDYDNTIDCSHGKVFECKLLGIEKSEKNSPGQLRCSFLTTDEAKGEITGNTKFGIFGKMEDTEGLVDPNLTLKLGGRLSVSPGKAYIVSSVSGIREEYEIEIIKASYQAKADDKSLVFRVKDKRLLELTGGIVQGMSGSPIIQNGKLVGAVTHVFMSDPTKGYGVYSDWMIHGGN